MKYINTELDSSIAVVKIERQAHLNALNKKGCHVVTVND